MKNKLYTESVHRKLAINEVDSDFSSARVLHSHKNSIIITEAVYTAK